MTILRSVAKVCAALAVALPSTLAGPLSAQTLPLAFAPPDMVVTPVCLARPSDADLTAEWRAWDGVNLPDRDVGLINRDMRRLAELDAEGWNDTIQKVISILPRATPSFTEDHVTLARIDQLVARGQLQELRASGLVESLLARGEDNSPRMSNALAGFLNEGIGIERDTARGAEFLMAAGYGGNADALLTLSRLAIAGKAPARWDINPQLAVTMAFGSLVGQIDPLICDRIARIAREFSNGEVVSVDHEMALRWYRFAADLGDPISAWRVAEYHLHSELIKKDNAELLTYLTKAAEGNLPYAQVALGRIYEAGALVPVDIDRARELYEAAAAIGDRAALIRLSGFYEARREENPAYDAGFLTTIDRLLVLDDAPAWAFSKKAAHLLSYQGRWAGQAAARALLEKGAAMEDPASIVMLAQMQFGAAQSPAEFYVPVDRLIHTVTTLGEAAPTADLQAAFMCKAPDAPRLEEAAYWAAAEAAIGSSSVEFDRPALAAMVRDPDPLAMAALQTQALYGRATPLANLLAVLENSGAPQSEVAFWTAFSERFPNVGTARATLALDFAANPTERAAALERLRAAVSAGDTGAPLKLAKALLADATLPELAEAAGVLKPLAEAGIGQAMDLLVLADPATYPTRRAVFDAFADVIEERGDFDAVILALPFLSDAEARKEYRGRAITAMTCSFAEAMAFAGAMGEIGDLDEARRWLNVATELAGEDSWQIVDLADSYRKLLGAEGEAVALGYYEQAYALGSRTAVQRLLRLQGNPDRKGYDHARVVELYADLVALSDPGQVPALLEELERKGPQVQAAVVARLDLDTLYLRAAEAGNPAAMREHARRLQQRATSREEIETSTGWLVAASEAGDTEAMVLLAQAYSMGVGVPASLADARGWLQKAAAAGDPQAVEMVKLFSVDQETN